MAEWYEAYPEAPAAQGKQWYEAYPEAPAGPPPSKLGQFGFNRPGVPEAFKRSYRGREIQQAATKEVLGEQARGVGELATLPGRVYSGQANLKDEPTLNQAIGLGMMMSPGSVAGRGGAVARGLKNEPVRGMERDVRPVEEARRQPPPMAQPSAPERRQVPGERAPLSDAELQAAIEELLGKKPVASQAPSEGTAGGGLDRPHAVPQRETVGNEPKYFVDQKAASGLTPELEESFLKYVSTPYKPLEETKRPINWSHAPDEITQEPPGEPQIIRKKGPTGKPPILGKPQIAKPKGVSEFSNEFKEKMKIAKAQGYDTKTTYYHGTGKDFEEFTQPYGSEPAVFLTKDPNIASVYAGGKDKPNVIPLLLKKGKTKTIDWQKVTGQGGYSSASMKYILNQSKGEGYDTVIINNIHDIGGNGVAQTQIAVLNPVGSLRAKFGAKFDPAMAASGNMLSAEKATQSTAAIIKAGKGIWGRPTAGRNLIRQQIGIKEQDTARQNLAFEESRRLSNEMTTQDSIDTIRYMQHRSADGPLDKLTVDPKFQGVADEIRRGYLAREADLRSLDEFTRMQFEEDHFTQKWQDPRKAKEVWDGWLSKEGSKGFTKHKKYLDFDAGLAAGLTPKSYNIVDVAMNDFANIDRVIAMARVREIAEDQGYIKWAENSRQVPSDWVPLKGYAAERGATRAFAPADFARNYNNFVGRGFLDTPLAGTFQALRAVTNGLTQLELGLSGYHGFTISREGLATGVADTVYAMSHGHPWQAAKNLGKTTDSPIYYAAKGLKAREIYLGLTPGSQLESRAVEALVQANAHLGQLEPALLSGKTRSLIKQFHRGAIAKDVANSLRHIREAEGALQTMGTTSVEAGRAVGEVLNTVSAPLFQHYIPAVKRGMMMDQMVQWLKTHPEASWDDIVTQAGELSDIADERFGEMKQDNLFWNPMVKQAAQLAMRSTSWAYGSWTQYAGGIKELAAIPSKGLGRRTSYLFADAFTTALIGGMTTYLMTGKGPNDWRDFIWGKTGGTTTVHAGKRTYKVDERVNLPGSIKEVVGVTAAIMDVKDYGSLSGFADYARNKENDFIKTMGELVTNQDWRGAPLINPWAKESIMKQWFNVGFQAFAPISLKQEEPDAGSKLNFPGSAFLGFRPAGRRWIDPEGYKQGVETRLQRSAKQNESYQARRSADRKPRTRHEDALSPN